MSDSSETLKNLQIKVFRLQTLLESEVFSQLSEVLANQISISSFSSASPPTETLLAKPLFDVERSPSSIIIKGNLLGLIALIDTATLALATQSESTTKLFIDNTHVDLKVQLKEGREPHS